MTTYFMELPNVCGVLNTQASKYCLPIKKHCSLTPDGIITLCGQEFNCNLCCGENHDPYFIPIDKSIPLVLQTQFFDRFNIDPTMPDMGFGSWITIDIIDQDGVIVGDHTSFSTEYFVGWNGTNSFQILKIYPEVPDFPTCFTIKYHVYQGDAVEDPTEGFCTQHFKVVDTCSMGNLYTIRGLHDKFDCEGNYYQLPLNSFGTIPFVYDNTIQVLGYEEQAEPERETIIINGEVKTQKIKYRKRILFPIIPLFMVKYLEDRIFSGQQVIINGEYVTVEIENTLSINDLCVFNYSILIIESCKINNC